MIEKEILRFAECGYSPIQIALSVGLTAMELRTRFHQVLQKGYKKALGLVKRKGRPPKPAEDKKNTEEGLQQAIYEAT